MKAPKGKGGDYFLIPEGEHLAVLVSIIDLGTQPVNSQQYGPSEKRRVRFTWELPEVRNVFKEENGEQPAVIIQEYTFSMYQNAKLRSDVQLMVGKPIKDEEAEEFDMATLLGKSFYLNVVHNDYNGSTFANIFTIRKGDKDVTPENTVYEFSLDSFNQELFNSLGEKTKEKIMKSPEYQELNDVKGEANFEEKKTNEEADFPF